MESFVILHLFLSQILLFKSNERRKDPYIGLADFF